MSEDLIDSLVAMPAAELDEFVRERELERRRVEAELALAAAVVEQRQQFLDDGHRSMSGYLKAHLNCSGREANRLRRLGKVINEHAQVGDALSSGHIGVDQADELAAANSNKRGGHRFGEFADLLVDHAEHLKFREFSIVVDRFVERADPDGTLGNDHDASATVAAGPNGAYVKMQGGTALEAAEMKAVFDKACQDQFDLDVEARRVEFGDDAANHPLPRTAPQRKFAAGHAIFMAYVTAPVGGQRPEPIVNILFSDEQFGRSLFEHGIVDDPDVFGLGIDGDADADSLLDRRCETSTGVVLHPDVALQAMVRGTVRRVVVDSSDVVINMGRERRLFTGKARDAAQLLVVSCSHPGCEVPAEFAEVDHLDSHSNGGATDQRNSGPGCGVHNRFKHSAGLRARRSKSGRIYLIRADNTTILPVGEREPDWPKPDWPDPEHEPSQRFEDLATIDWAEFRAAAPQRSRAELEADGWTIETIHI